MKIYEVGGCVRDALLGVPSKDVDFVVVTPGGYEAMREYLVTNGFVIYQERKEYSTIRANVPDSHPLRARVKDADFVLARKDGPSSDGRHPDYVENGTLEDDLARRDFTVNAMAKCTETGKIIDLFDGQYDLDRKILRFVGDPKVRIYEDGLRVMRALRFMVTKDLIPSTETAEALATPEAAVRVRGVAVERIGDELDKMLAHNTNRSICLLASLPYSLRMAIFRDGLKLEPSLKGRKPGVATKTKKLDEVA